MIPIAVILTLIIIFLPTLFLYNEIEETDKKAEKEKCK